VWRAARNSFVGLNTAFALRAGPALWRANGAWSSPMIASAAASGIRWPLNFELNALPANRWIATILTAATGFEKLPGSPFHLLKSAAPVEKSIS